MDIEKELPEIEYKEEHYEEDPSLPKIEPIYEENEKKQKYRYIFPNFLAKMMARVDERTQYESSMMSMFFILLGIIMFSTFLILFTDYTLFMKIMTGLNGFFAFIFISSSLVTTYQQYLTYMTAIKLYDKEDKPKRVSLFTKIFRRKE